MLPLGAMPMVPVQAGPRSDRISPNKLEPTTTSNQSGCRTKFAVRMSMWNLSQRTSGNDFATASTRSSQYGMVMEMPFDFVAEAPAFGDQVQRHFHHPAGLGRGGRGGRENPF